VGVGIGGLRHVVIDDVRNTQNINATGGNVSRHQDFNRAGTEAINGSLYVGNSDLRSGTMSGGG
jgi:hypothetical protein